MKNYIDLTFPEEIIFFLFFFFEAWLFSYLPINHIITGCCFNLHFTFTFKAFSRRFCHTYICTLMAVAAMQGANQHTSGAVWGSVSCPKTLRHADQGNRTSDFPITWPWLYSWVTAAILTFDVYLGNFRWNLGITVESVLLNTSFTVGTFCHFSYLFILNFQFPIMAHLINPFFKSFSCFSHNDGVICAPHVLYICYYHIHLVPNTPRGHL